MRSTKFRVTSIVLSALLAFFFLAGAVWATTENDYSMWVNSGFRDFFHGEFTNVCADPDRDSLLLKKVDHSSDYYASGEFISPVYKADKGFDGLFVSWIDACESSDQLRVFIRVGDDGRKFGEWAEVHRESELLFGENHNYIQYKISMTSESQKTTPELKSLAISYADLYDEMKDLKPETTDYPVMAATPEIIERAAWGAAKPNGSYASQVPTAIILHHSYIPNVSQYKGAASIRGIQNYHMNDPHTGWTDIGYHFLIGPDGKIYRGRPENAVGSHCVPNSNKIGICCIGDYDPDKDPLPAKLYASLQKLLPYVASKYKISKSRLYGHRDFSSKTCPGETVYQKLPELKKLMVKFLGL